MSLNVKDRASKNFSTSQLAESPPERKLFYTVPQAADQLGISSRTLYHLADEHDLYAPSARGFPGAHTGRSRLAYHHRHLELIAAVRMGVMAPDEGLLRWKVEKGRMAQGGE